MDSVKVPVVAVDVAAMVRTEPAPAVTEAGLKVPVAPAASPPTDRLTVPAGPDVACVPTLYVVLDTWTTLCADGLAEIEKSSGTGAVNVRLTEVVCVAGGEASLPVMISSNVPEGVAGRV